MKSKFLIIVLLISIISCNKKTDCIKAPDISKVSANAKIVRLDQELKTLTTKEEIKLFLDKYPLLSENMFERSKLPHDSILINDFYNLTSNKYLDTIYRDVDKVFKDVSEIESQLTTAFKHIKYYYPEFKAPKVYTLVTGFSNDLFVSDSVIVIGLDYFLGTESYYKPKVPEYILSRYNKEFIVPSIILLMSEKFNKTDMVDKSLLAEMIYYGKSYYFTKNILPCTPDSLIIGYTSDQIKEVDENQEIIWGHFIKNQLLFKTNHFEINRYIGERPFVPEIGDKSPGRIGRWVGWQIVKKYADRTEATLPEVMANRNAKSIFDQSRYKPER